MAAELTCPPLGTGTVDMNALSEAAKKAKTPEDLAEALAKATTNPKPSKEPAPDPDAPTANTAT